MSKYYDAVVVGSGPNGLAAAITVAQRGGSVLVLEGAAEAGGGMRSSELTLPGYVHDVCSAVHPLAISSPFLRRLPLENYGLKWIHSPYVLAHPLDLGVSSATDFGMSAKGISSQTVILRRSIKDTAASLGEDAENYIRLMKPLVERADELLEEILQPTLHWPKHPLLLAQFGMDAMRSARGLAQAKFRGPRARALFAGNAGHSMISLNWSLSSAIALVLGVAAHTRGWPIPQGGSRALAKAMILYLQSLGGEIQTGIQVRSLKDLPFRKWVFLDVTPMQWVEMSGSGLSPNQAKPYRQFRLGCGVYKMDFALSGPIPWSDPECSKAATVHLGGMLEEIEKSEQEVSEGKPPSNPFVLLSQPSLFDPTRVPKEGHHTAWAYCHVPNGSQADMSHAIEKQIERFAPGFQSRILARHHFSPLDFERYNPNYRGGDISGGALNSWQALFRPKFSLHPYQTPVPGVYLCSSSTPPGPGVHGMCGHLAALAAIRSNPN